jgi:hypothetical protein
MTSAQLFSASNARSTASIWPRIDQFLGPLGALPVGIIRRIGDVRGIGFLDVDWFALPVSSQPCGELIGGVAQPPERVFMPQMRHSSPSR